MLGLSALTELPKVVDEMALEVLDCHGTYAGREKKKPKRFVGRCSRMQRWCFAMIYERSHLHVAREPMDTIFSAYEFHRGLWTHSDFPVWRNSITRTATLWLMGHGVAWSRDTVRYEDMVHDMPGWLEPSLTPLNFHGMIVC
jgi:hypothetical protein